MKLSWKLSIAAVAVIAAIIPVAISNAGTTEAVTTATVENESMPAAPYLYPGWGNAPDPAEVIEATGIKAFTLAFVVAGEGCAPVWAGETGLTGGVHAAAIETIKAAGAEVIPSIGGWSGDKLGPACSTAEDLAEAYQQVIDATGTGTIDVDIENADEFQDYDVQDRILQALKLVKAANPGLTTILTFSTTATGPNADGQRLIARAAELDAGIDVFTQMPFNIAEGTDIYATTVGATEGLRDELIEVFGYTEAEAYRHMGVSAMNGLSDQGEVTTLETFTKIREYAAANGLARLSVWSVNRDRGCTTEEVTSDCSGIEQDDWAFTSEAAKF
ncbi:MAG TPA: chitinase [Actinoplanes sp.]|nr:chitinase [Actinoplanes sp.]